MNFTALDGRRSPVNFTGFPQILMPVNNGYRVAHFEAPITACRGCSLRARCLRHPERTPQRTVCFIKGREGPRTESKKQGVVDRMRFKFDTAAGRAIYSRRMGTVEPVFGNLQNKGTRSMDPM